MWQVFKHLDLTRLPAERRVVRFELRGVRRQYWLVLQRDDPDLCYSDPGFGDDLVVRAGIEALVRVYLGQWSLVDALLSGQVETQGSRELARGLLEWFPCSGFASHAKPVRFDRSTQSFVLQSA